MDSELLHKFHSLTHWFKQQDSVTVAYSGGVDSALLLYLGSQILGDKQCRGFFADSCLMSREARHSCLSFAKTYHLDVHTIPLDPLDFQGFKRNQADRCYICKFQTYQVFIKRLPPQSLLVDGTNCDDLHRDRPGFKAVKLLGVATPYLDCQVSKSDIRSLSYHLGLPTWDKLSDSCLATRVNVGSGITKKQLHVIDQLESEFHHIGLGGCRVTTRKDAIFLTVRTGQRALCLDPGFDQSVRDICQRFNFSKVFLDLSEREGILPLLLDYIGFAGDNGPAKQLITYFNKMSGIS